MAKPQVDIVFDWTDERDRAAVLLAQGYSNTETAKQVGVDTSTIWRWMQKEPFAKEVDNLTMMYGVANKMHRLRLLNQAIRQMIDENGQIDLTGVKFTDLIKEARMQTEGLRLGILEKITALDEAAGFAPGIGPGGTAELLQETAEETD